MEKTIRADTYSNELPEPNLRIETFLGENALPRQTSSANILAPQKVSWVIIKSN